jgi:hypothetical protein
MGNLSLPASAGSVTNARSFFFSDDSRSPVNATLALLLPKTYVHTT